MNPLIFSGGANFGRIPPDYARRRCQDCIGGRTEGEDGSLLHHLPCGGTGWLDVPLPRQKRPQPIRNPAGDGVEDDARTVAALGAYKEATARLSPWRDAVRAALRAADAVGGRVIPILAAIAALATVSCSHPQKTAAVASVPICPGCLPAYSPLKWTMTLYSVDGGAPLLYRVGRYDDEKDCWWDGLQLHNIDVYAVCKPIPNV